MSVSFRKTIAALAFSEAAANVILTSADQHPDVIESAKRIKQYCNDAYPLLNERLKAKDIKKFGKAAQVVNMKWENGYVIEGQKMITWCSFLIDEPLQKTCKPKLKACLGSIADLLMHILGILEERDGYTLLGSIDDAHETYKKWREAGWI